MQSEGPMRKPERLTMCTLAGDQTFGVNRA